MLKAPSGEPFFMSIPVTQSKEDGAPIDELEALRRLQQKDDPASRYYAAWWLGRERSCHPKTLPLLKEALREFLEPATLPSEDSRALALNVLRALVHLDGTEARHEILACLEHEDTSVREEAARTAGAAGFQEAVPVLCASLSGADLSAERLLEAQLEALGDLGQCSPDVVAVLEGFQRHDRPLIRSASSRALVQLTDQARWSETFPELLQHPSTQVRRGVLLDIGASGWIPALDLIRDSPVENSIKLIALRGLAERPRGLQHAGLSRERAVEAVMETMDNLL